ncbi:acyl-CoA-binding domain-containing protein 6-like [Nymphaea colorata]|nr:acyl-CoA-binding domain-containing protein 6-like [Nymphaea colorata]
MRWERVNVLIRSKEGLEGKKSPGRRGGILGPGKRWGHTCNSIKGGRFLYVFGGYGKDNCQTNEVHVFDTIKQTWSKPMVKGVPPLPRDSHSCTTVGNKLFVFGGTDGQNPLNDLHVLDTSTNTWTQPIVSGDGPEAREGHSATLVGRHLFIFGGCGKSFEEDEEIYYNNLYILDTETLVWKRAVTTGSPPSARDSHTCSSWKNKVVVLGGEDASDCYLSDVYILDADTLVWKELNTSGQVLAPRAGHCTVALGKYLFVFGGFTHDRTLYDDLHILNVDTGIWSKISNACQGPSARFSVAGDCVDLWKGVLVFIGGCNEKLEALDDMYYLYTDMLMENGQHEHRLEKLSLRKELKRKRQEHHLNSSNFVPKLDKMPDGYHSFPYLKHGETGKLLELGISKHGGYRVSPMDPTYDPISGTDAHSLSVSKPAEEKLFEATVIDILHCGYAIQTSIDGKSLRGILFSYTPSFIYDVHARVSRRRMSKECPAVEGNDISKAKTKSDGSFKQESENTKSDAPPNANKSATPELSGEADPSLSDDSTPSVAIRHKNLASYDSETTQVLSGAPKPEAAPAVEEVHSHGLTLPEEESITSMAQGVDVLGPVAEKALPMHDDGQQLAGSC